MRRPRFFRSEDPGCNSSVHSIKLPDVTGQSSWAEHLSAEQHGPCTVTKLMQSKAEPVLPMANNSGHNQRLFSYPGNRGRKRLFHLDSPFHKYFFYFLGQRCIEFFQQWLGWIPSCSLSESCSGLQALVINPTSTGCCGWEGPYLSCAISCTQVCHQKSAVTLQCSPFPSKSEEQGFKRRN